MTGWGTPGRGRVFGPSSPQQVNELHATSDVDTSFLAQHHTCGKGATQASPGGHVHDGADSLRLDPTELGLPAGSAAGDLLVADGTAWVRLARGGDGTLLAAEGAGLRWRPPPGALFPARAVRTANLPPAAPGTPTCDGVVLAAGDRVLLVAQTAAAENGLYDYHGSGTPLTRCADAEDGAALAAGVLVPVCEGTLFADSTWQLATNGAVVVGVTGLDFRVHDLATGGFLAVPASSAAAFTNTNAPPTTMVSVVVTVPDRLPAGRRVRVVGTVGNASSPAGVGLVLDLTNTSEGAAYTSGGSFAGSPTVTRYDPNPPAGARTYSFTLATTVGGSTVTVNRVPALYAELV